MRMFILYRLSGSLKDTSSQENDKIQRISLEERTWIKHYKQQWYRRIYVTKSGHKRPNYGIID